MSIWDELGQELDLWQDIGLVAEFWWRDDDAIAATDALEQLLASAGETPINIAVIPKFAESGLSQRLQKEKNVTISQHGWQHVNHAPKGHKKAEFKEGRHKTLQSKDIIQGHQRLTQLFDQQFLPVFVPPWNRIDASGAEALAEAGIKLLSTFNARSGREPDIARLNTHMDIIDWRGSRGFAGDDFVLAQALTHLKDRRLQNRIDPAEPTGLLSHHLVHDPGCWYFLNKFNNFIRKHPAACWIGADTELNRREQTS
ncbi:polysaccharide deacetylase family protein [Aestuariispira insulae]|uniref:Nodulation protein B n=1 Tax=Aestuariispira insulae TaxID=1461337 RepID=A0A3D9HPA9_9PROT|nr:polysaccharide deacetylase family protein [Aestuariispira insulae]RED51333.1 hypothetical protein DFP90_103133 [Aestuariispira insulae]